MKKIFIGVCFLFVMAFVLAFSKTVVASTYTYLEHLQAVNEMVCDKLKDTKEFAGKFGSVDACIAKFNTISESNPNNKTIQVDIGKSGYCVGKLLITKPEEVLAKSVEGPCALSELQASGSESAPTAAAPSDKPAEAVKAEAPVAVAPAPASGFRVGDKVLVKWGESWWLAEVLQVKDGPKYYIRYDGYADSWNEWVGTDRIQSRK